MTYTLSAFSLLIVAALLTSPGVRADAHDHDRARAALERGEVRPVSEVLATVTAEVPGDVVEVELEREQGRWVYELRVVAPDGRVLEVLVDGATASLIEGEDD